MVETKMNNNYSHFIRVDTDNWSERDWKMSIM